MRVSLNSFSLHHMQLYNWQQQQCFQFACKFSNTEGRIDLHVIATHNPVSRTLELSYDDLSLCCSLAMHYTFSGAN